MKNKFIYKIKLILVGVVLIVVSSCADMIPDTEAFSTAERVESVVLGVYEAAQRGYYNESVVNGRGYPFGAASVEQGDMRGEDMYNDQAFYEITYIGAYDPNSANNNGMWISLYRVINRANITMENLNKAVENGVIDASTRDQYRGEMLFLRALSHHELLIHFARPYSDDPSSLGIPYRIFATDDVGKVVEGEEVGRTTVGEDYQQLLEDLDEAEGLLASGNEVYRATKGAAIALKSRIKLHMRDWNGVLEEYEKMGDYGVTNDPEAPFRSETSDNVFGFANSAESNPTTNGALPAMYGNPTNGGRGLVKISPLIWRADFWHEDDIRRTMTSSNTAGIYTEKYDDPVTRTNPAPTIRFSEIVLNTAEAHARSGSIENAVDLLNEIRDRALPENVPSYTVANFGGEAEVLEAIFNERRIEFLAEGRRWSDIHRLSGEGLMNGIPSKAASRSVSSLQFYTGEREVSTSHGIPYSDYRFIWPIPLSEIQNNNTSPIEQNPGY